MRTLRIGTRGSALARWQAEHVRDLLGTQGYQCELHVITTSGDRGDRRPTAEITGKALFTKEIEEALLANEVDLAVHSLKDMSIAMPAGLVIGAVPPREDPRDAVIHGEGSGLDALRPGATVGTGSIRRRSAIRALRPDLEVVTIRGNVPTRLKRVADGEVDAAVLAMAGLKRLDLASGAVPIETSRLVPAPGQGALGLQIREDDEELREAMVKIDDHDTHVAVMAERGALDGIESGCSVPIGAHCRRLDQGMKLTVAVYAVDGSQTITAIVSVDPNDPEESGRAAADELKGKGAHDLIALAIEAAAQEGG